MQRVIFLCNSGFLLSSSGNGRAITNLNRGFGGRQLPPATRSTGRKPDSETACTGSEAAGRGSRRFPGRQSAGKSVYFVSRQTPIVKPIRMRLLIADSGATKTDWAYIDVHEGKPVFMKTGGLHPAYIDPVPVLTELKRSLSQCRPDLLIFYGAGCYSAEASMPVRHLMKEAFGDIPMEIRDDLTAVAHAFLGDAEGIVGILGTGSASGYFFAGERKEQVASLGYVLGDEGSASDIGKRILKSALRGEFSRSVMQYLESRLESLEYRDIMSALYGARRPSYYLADTAKAVLTGRYPSEIGNVVLAGFQSYMDSHLKRYRGFPMLPVILSGGMAVGEEDKIRHLLKQNAVEKMTVSGGVISALADRQIRRMK